jgi:DNA-binding Lrp family transcriptional regulator
VAVLDEQVGRRDDPPVRGGDDGRVVTRPDQRGVDRRQVAGDPLDQAELAQIRNCDDPCPLGLRPIVARRPALRSTRPEVPTRRGHAPMSVNAYILIQTEVGKAADVAREIGDLDGVTNAEDVTGPYDVIVRAEAETVDELGKLVVARVQAVAGITRTLTCPVVNL